METYDKLSKAEVRSIQYDLRVLEYNPGIADGQIVPKTIRALSLFINDNNIIDFATNIQIPNIQGACNDNGL